MGACGSASHMVHRSLHNGTYACQLHTYDRKSVLLLFLSYSEHYRTGSRIYDAYESDAVFPHNQNNYLYGGALYDTFRSGEYCRRFRKTKYRLVKKAAAVLSEKSVARRAVFFFTILNLSLVSDII